MLQQLERDDTQDVSVNDCFRVVSSYWDRISRPEQLLTALPEVPATLWLETQHETDEQLPLRTDPARHEVHRLRREDAGASEYLLRPVVEEPEAIDQLAEAVADVADR